METTKSEKKQGCVVLIHENGDTRRRWVQEVTWYVRGRNERRLTGDRLPQSISIRLGMTQKAYSVLELFDDDATRPLFAEAKSGSLGRDVTIGITAIMAAQIVLAFLDAVARAMQ